MKILMVDRYLYPFGGAETYMLAIAEYMKKQGHFVEFFGMQHSGNIVGNSVGQYTRYMDFHSNSLSRLIYPFTIIYSTEARRKLRKIIEAYQPDVIHLHGYNFQLTPSIIYEIKRHHVPLIATIHDPQIACPCHRLYIEHKGTPCTKCITGKYYHCIKNRCTFGSLAKSILSTIESYLYHMLKTYEKIDRFILPSQFMYNILKTNGIPVEKMTILQNFSRMDRTIKPAVRTGEKFVLYFGRLSKEKGIETLAMVCKELPEVRFKIAGTGPFVEAFNGLGNVEMQGFIIGEALNRLISEAAFSVYPSEWPENCPMSVLESQILGTPVIGANIGGIPELIENGKSGILFESGNKDDLKKAITKLYFDDVNQRKMQTFCRNSTKLQDTSEYCNSLFKIYFSLITKENNDLEEIFKAGGDKNVGNRFNTNI